MRVDQRRIYVHGLSERAGHGTSLGTKPRSVVPSPTPILLPARVAERLSARGGQKSPLNNHPAARRKASSVHVHVTAARPS